MKSKLKVKNSGTVGELDEDHEVEKMVDTNNAAV